MNHTDTTEEVRVPVAAEELFVEKRTIETGRVRIQKTVRTDDVIVEEPLIHEDVSIIRVPVDRLCDGPAPVSRQEGETLIIPVFEEVLMVEKRLLLKEELHVRRQQRTVQAHQSETLRREEVTVDRSEASVAPEDS